MSKTRLPRTTGGQFDYSLRLAVLAIATSWTTACVERSESTDNINVDESAIQGGQREVGFPAVGAIIGSDHVSICTGELISPNYVLTAKHGACLTGMVFNTGDSQANWVSHSIDSTILHPTQDLLLAHLATPITTIAPLPFNTGGLPTVGATCTAVGVGDHGMPPPHDGKKFSCTETITSSSTTQISVQRGTGITDQGDSGGPLLCSGQIAGADSTGDGVTIANYATVDPYWINEYGLGNTLLIQRWETKDGGFDSTQQWVAGDFTGDGKTDLANIWNDSGMTSIDVHVSNGSGFSIQRWATRIGVFDATQKWIAGDFNGDGTYVDLARVFNDTGLASVDVYVSTGTAPFQVGARWQTKAGGFDSTQKWIAGNFDNDPHHYADLANVWNDAGSASVDVHRSSGSSFNIERWQTRAGGFDVTQNWVAGDFDHNGYVDLANIWNDTGLASIDVHPSTGSAFGIQRWQTKSGSFDSTQRWFAGDFDNDGFADIAVVSNDGGLASIDVHLESGGTFGNQRWENKAGGFDSTEKWSVGDFTGDHVGSGLGRASLANAWNDTGLVSIDVHRHQ